MYGILLYLLLICHITQLNVGKYTIITWMVWVNKALRHFLQSDPNLFEFPDDVG